MTEVDALGAWIPTEETGIKEQELWSLDATLTDYILPRITAFREMERHGFPALLSEVPIDQQGTLEEHEEAAMTEGLTEGLERTELEQSELTERAMADWENVLRSIELAFTTMKSVQHFERSTTQNNDIKSGLKLFAEYYEYLWD